MMNYEDEDYVYRLTGVCIHRGRANSGHYWSLIHMKRGSEEPDSTKDEWSDLSQFWKEFNDERVSFFYAKNLEEQGYGGYMTESELKAYAGSSGEDWSKSAYMLVYERKHKTELRQIVKDKEADVVEMVDFNAMPKEIPTWISEAIKKDNRVHVADT
jgi:ubiquitin carboxyl-terminal hydrolase 34